jgi:catechol 2,3-dioxygenase-like lactoylglutathione lyase family enzyme
VLSDTNLTTLAAVDDLDAAAVFYEQALGLERTEISGPGWIQFRSGASNLIVYVSDHAGSNRATTAAWTVDDVESTVRELKAKGVGSFQQYDDLPGATRQGDVHHAGKVKMAWFTDPAGNIFEVNGR